MSEEKEIRKLIKKAFDQKIFELEEIYEIVRNKFYKNDFEIDQENEIISDECQLEYGDETDSINDEELSQNDKSSIKVLYINEIICHYRKECEFLIVEKCEGDNANKLLDFYKLNKSFISSPNFDCIPELFHNETFKIIKKFRDIFDDDDLMTLSRNLAFLFNENVTVKFSDAGKKEIEFLKCFIILLRECKKAEVEVIKEGLMLNKFKNKEILIKEVINLINSKPDLIAQDSYKILHDLSKSFTSSSNFIFEEFIYEELSPFLSEREVKIFQENSIKVHEISGKVIYIENQFEVDEGINEIRFVGDVVQILSHFKLNVNLTIIANKIKVLEEAVIDLSGSDGVKTFSTDDAGVNDQERGKNGRDGSAGKSGANCYISCKSIENSNLLTIKSNGGNGSDGQNGGDGVNGRNGRNAIKADFTYDGVKFGGSMVANRNWNSSLAGRKLEEDADGVRRTLFIQQKQVVLTLATEFSLMHIQGKQGERGTLGGLPGLGGEGGFAGQINIEVEDKSNPVRIENFDGKNGKDGTPGLNGINGNDGRDLWGYDQSWKSPKYHGLRENRKYKLVYSVDGDCSGIDNVWVESLNQYVHVEPCNIRKTVNQVTRREKSQKQTRAFYARAKKSKNINIKGVKIKYGNSLKNPFERLDSELSDVLDMVEIAKEMSSQKVKTKITIQVAQNNEAIQKEIDNPKSEISFDFAKKEIQKDRISIEFFLKIISQRSLELSELDQLIEILKRKTDDLPKSARDSTPMFILYNNKSELFINIHDAVSMLEEKISLLQYQKAYREFLKLKIPEIKNQEFCKPSFDQEDIRINYLLDTKQFNCEQKVTVELNLDEKDENNFCFAILDHYFISDTQLNRKQILYFYLKIKKDAIKAFKKVDEFGKKYTNFFISILGLLYKNIKELEEIEIHLNKFKKDYEKLKRSSEEKIHKKLSKIFENYEISKFIEDNIMDEGINSPIYRKLITLAFEIDLKVYVRRLDGSLSLAEEHWLAEINKEKKSNSQVSLLMNEKNFSVLEFDAVKYRKHQEREILAKNTFEFIEQFEASKSDKILKNLMADDFTNNEEMIRIILKYFLIPTQKDQNILQDIVYDLSLVGGSKLLKVINVCLFYEDCELSIGEFSLISMKILELITENPGMKNFFISQLVSTHHTEWINDIILMQIEDYLKEISPKSLIEWREILNEVSSRNILFLFLNKILQLNEKDMTEEDFDKVIKNMHHFSENNFQELLKVENLDAWQYMMTWLYWEKNYPFLKAVNDSKILINGLASKYSAESLEGLLNIIKDKIEKNIKIEDKKILEVLANFETSEWIFSEELLEILRTNEPKDWTEKVNDVYTARFFQRRIDQITRIIKENADTSQGIINSMDQIKKETDAIRHERCTKTSKVITEFTIEEIKSWINNKEIVKTSTLVHRLAIVLRAFELITDNELRYTQICAILTLWHNQKGALIQVGTGEGKTYIGIAFSILKYLKGEKVHIITSSSVLAKRDAEDEENLKIFKVFGMKVGHNCHDDIQKRRFAYKECDVVYGFLSSFQRDYLLTQFYDENILKEENLQNVLVDEVDSILLDKGNNILYLSQELPDIDEIISVLTFIWQWINQNASNKENIIKNENVREAVLDNLYGVIHERDIKKMIADSADIAPEHIFNYLKNIKFIDDENTLIIDQEGSFKTILETMRSSKVNLPSDLAKNIAYYIKHKLESPKAIKFSSYHQKFVMQHLNKWIESAQNALVMEDGRQYIVDRTHDSNSTDKDPNIIIMDIDTGTDQKNSEWDEALCQFLQLKHGCRLSFMSLKSVFISNVTYFKLYQNKYGMTGTLGTIQERKKLTDLYNLEYATIPTFLARKFSEYKGVIAKDPNEWLNNIVTDVNTVLKSKKRSVLVICKTIRDINIIEKAFDRIPKEKIFIYQRDYEGFDLGKLEPGRLILATNLAGRGTDIKLSNNLLRNGGLHVILTYLPPNIRIEQQAFGRASRAGAKGSARLIILKNTNQLLADLKSERDKNELIRLDKVSDYYTNFITIEEELFGRFKDSYKEYSKKLENIKENSNLSKILLENFKIQWSLWLDQFADNLKDWNKSGEEISDQKKKILNSFGVFLSTATVITSDYTKIKLHPVSRLKLARYLDEHHKIDDAINLLNRGNMEGGIKLRDSVAENYFLVYFMIKKNSMVNDFKPRSLNQEEIRLVQKVIKDFSKKETERNFRTSMMNILRENYRGTIIKIRGFEHQEDAINKVVNFYIESLRKILGCGITSESFSCSPLNHPITKESFYKFLMREGFISKVRVDKNFDDLVFDKVAKKYSISGADLKKNLPINEIDDFEKFTSNLKKVFDFASRESFWEILIDEEILKDQVKYAIIDYGAFKNFHPDALKIIDEKFGSLKLIEGLKIESQSQIFLYNVIEDNESILKSEKIAIVLTVEIKRDPFYKKLLDYNLVTYNERAKFDVEKFDEVKGKFFFQNFDSVESEDLHEDEEIRKVILDLMVKSKILYKSKDYDSSYRLDLTKLNTLKLGKYFMFQDKIIEVITTKFQFRIALETIASRIRQNILKDEYLNETTIHLHTHPHLMLINELIDEFILLSSKVNQIKDLRERFHVPIIDEFLTFLPCDVRHSEKENLKSFLMSNKNVNELPNNYEDLKDSVKLVLSRIAMLNINCENIEKTMKDAEAALSSKNVKKPKPILILFGESGYTIDYETLNYLRIKGLEVIIEFKDDHWWTQHREKFLIALLTISGLIKVGIGIFGMYYSFKLGSLFGAQSAFALTKDGFNDLTFAINTIRSNRFSWKSYGYHKLKNVLEYFIGYHSEIAKTLENFAVKQGVDKKKTEKAFKYGSEFISNSIKSMVSAEDSVKASQEISNHIATLTESISDEVSKSLKEKFEKHEISKNILELLKHKNVDEVTVILKSKVNEYVQSQSIFNDTIKKMKEEVNEAMSVDDSMNSIEFIDVKKITKGSISYDVLAIFNHLNQNLKSTIKVKEGEEIQGQDLQELKREVFEIMQNDFKQRLKISISQNITSKLMSQADDEGFDLAFAPFTDLTKQMRRNRKFTKDVASMELRLRNLQKKGKIEADDVLYKLNMIKLSKDVKFKTFEAETFARFIKYDFPLNDSEVEAFAKYFGKKIVIDLYGRKSVFGSQGDYIGINIIEDHYSALNDGISLVSRDCVYKNLREKSNIPEIDAEKFRSEISREILNDVILMSMITSTEKRHKIDLGFFSRSSLRHRNFEIEMSYQEKFAKRTFFGPQRFKFQFAYDNRKKVQNKYINDVADMKTYNILRNESIRKAIAEINEKLQTLSPELVLVLKDFTVTEFIKVKAEKNEFLLFPICLEMSHENLKIFIDEKVKMKSKLTLNERDKKINFKKEKPDNLDEFKKELKKGLASVTIYIENPLLSSHIIRQQKNKLLGSVFYEIYSKFGGKDTKTIDKDVGFVAFGNLKLSDKKGNPIYAPGRVIDGRLIYESNLVDGDENLSSRVLNYLEVFDIKSKYLNTGFVTFDSKYDINLPTY